MSKTERSLDELYELKYDTTLDLYQRVAHAREVAVYHDFYEQVLESGELTHPQMEFYVYKIFGSDLIGSIAFAIDPFWQIAKAPKGHFYDKYREVLKIEGQVPITPVNRTRTRPGIFPFTCVLNEHRIRTITSNQLAYVGGNYVMVPAVPIVVNSDYSYSTGSQKLFLDTVKDTTWKTRNPKAKLKSRDIRKHKVLGSQGEFEKFSLSKFRTPFIWGCEDNLVTDVEMAVGHNLWQHQHTRTQYSGSCDDITRIDVTTIPLIQNALVARANAIMADNASAMFARCVPQRRYYNLAYQISELKDLPQLLRSTLYSWYAFQSAVGGAKNFVTILSKPSWWVEKNVAKIAGPLRSLGFRSDLNKDLADLYLSFKFGWESTLQAVVSLLKRPFQAADDVNRLIKRNGKFSNLHAKNSWIEEFKNPPSLTFGSWQQYLSNDPANPTTSVGVLNVELSCMANCGINFPTVDVPGFRSKLFWEKLGLYPTPGDLYDIIPWTWLVDWFAGIGEYFHLMDALNGDRSLINYGFMTAKLGLEVKSTHGYYRHVSDAIKIEPPDTVNTPLHIIRDEDVKWLVTGQYTVNYEVRRSLSSLADVKYVSGHGLSAYQSNVLSALFAKFT